MDRNGRSSVAGFLAGPPFRLAASVAAALAVLAGCTQAPPPPLVTTPVARTSAVLPTDTSHIVVGVDGSGSSRAALDWALAEAALRGSTIRAVHAWEIPALGTGEAPWALIPPGDYVDMSTGEIEVHATSLRIVGPATTPAIPLGES